jgi:hypothetical protein
LCVRTQPRWDSPQGENNAAEGPSAQGNDGDAISEPRRALQKVRSSSGRRCRCSSVASSRCGCWPPWHVQRSSPAATCTSGSSPPPRSERRKSAPHRTGGRVCSSGGRAAERGGRGSRHDTDGPYRRHRAAGPFIRHKHSPSPLLWFLPLAPRSTSAPYFSVLSLTCLLVMAATGLTAPLPPATAAVHRAGAPGEPTWARQSDFCPPRRDATREAPRSSRYLKLSRPVHIEERIT